MKAGVTDKIGDFKYASSIYLKKQGVPLVKMHCLNLDMLVNLENTTGLLGGSEGIINEKDEKSISAIFQAKFKKKDNDIVRIKNKPLSYYTLLNCDKKTRNKNINKAVSDGYKQSELSTYLGVSSVLISKVVKQHRIKVVLFKKLKVKS